MTKSIIEVAWISELDAASGVWSVQTRDRQFYKQSKARLHQQVDGYTTLIECTEHQLIR